MSLPYETKGATSPYRTLDTQDYTTSVGVDEVASKACFLSDTSKTLCNFALDLNIAAAGLRDAQVHYDNCKQQYVSSLTSLDHALNDLGKELQTRGAL